APVPQPTVKELALDVARGGMSREQYALTMRALESALVDMIEKQAAADHTKLPASFRTAVARFVDRYTGYDVLCALLADFYATEFAASELREIVRFQGTAAFQKQVNLMPKLVQSSARVAEEAFAK